MGQKVNPIGLRIGIIKDWNSKWYANKENFATILHEDLKIRKLIEDKYKREYSKVELERNQKRILVSIHTAKPGIILGKDGENIKNLTKELKKITKEEIKIDVIEIKHPDSDAKFLADSIAQQLENRASFRVAQKQIIRRAMKSAGVVGVKTLVSGRLGGVDMARSEGYSQGNVSLHTLRNDIDYATSEAHTTYGRLGIKVWINKGDVLKKGGK